MAVNASGIVRRLRQAMLRAKKSQHKLRLQKVLIYE